MRRMGSDRNASSPSPRKSKRQGSFRVCWARSEPRAAKVRSKFVTAMPWRSFGLVDPATVLRAGGVGRRRLDPAIAAERRGYGTSKLEVVQFISDGTTTPAAILQ